MSKAESISCQLVNHSNTACTVATNPYLALCNAIGSIPLIVACFVVWVAMYFCSIARSKYSQNLNLTSRVASQCPCGALEDEVLETLQGKY